MNTSADRRRRPSHFPDSWADALPANTATRNRAATVGPAARGLRAAGAAAPDRRTVAATGRYVFPSSARAPFSTTTARRVPGRAPTTAPISADGPWFPPSRTVSSQVGVNPLGGNASGCGTTSATLLLRAPYASRRTGPRLGRRDHRVRGQHGAGDFTPPTSTSRSTRRRRRSPVSFLQAAAGHQVQAYSRPPPHRAGAARIRRGSHRRAPGGPRRTRHRQAIPVG